MNINININIKHIYVCFHNPQNFIFFVPIFLSLDSDQLDAIVSPAHHRTISKNSPTQSMDIRLFLHLFIQLCVNWSL